MFVGKACVFLPIACTPKRDRPLFFSVLLANLHVPKGISSCVFRTYSCSDALGYHRYGLQKTKRVLLNRGGANRRCHACVFR